MEDFKQKLLEETQLEAGKLNNLNKFMNSNVFINLTRIEKDLLYEQCRTINTFVQILGKRLEYYGIKFVNKI